MNDEQGLPVSDQGLAEWRALRERFAPDQGAKRIEDFAKWLFGGTAALTSIALAYNTAAGTSARPLGHGWVAAAVLAQTASMLCSALTLAPIWLPVNRNSLDQMQAAVAQQYRSKRGTLTAATIFFALSLAIIGVAPLFSAEPAAPRSVPVIASEYGLSGTRRLGAEAEGTGLEPGSELAVRISRRDGADFLRIAEAVASARRDGGAAASIAPFELDNAQGEYRVDVLHKTGGVEFECASHRVTLAEQKSTAHPPAPTSAPNPSADG
ncbi:MAG: hypothetical protein EPO68_12900 [Planctomycetota bacterium]|nr:MAG: hypothetical protein EPO68_12900 [Planctomycetota bacterium]